MFALTTIAAFVRSMPMRMQPAAGRALYVHELGDLPAMRRVMQKASLLSSVRR